MRKAVLSVLSALAVIVPVGAFSLGGAGQAGAVIDPLVTTESCPGQPGSLELSSFAPTGTYVFSSADASIDSGIVTMDSSGDGHVAMTLDDSVGTDISVAATPVDGTGHPTGDAVNYDVTLQQPYLTVWTDPPPRTWSLQFGCFGPGDQISVTTSIPVRSTSAPVPAGSDGTATLQVTPLVTTGVTALTVTATDETTGRTGSWTANVGGTTLLPGQSITEDQYQAPFNSADGYFQAALEACDLVETLYTVTDGVARRMQRWTVGSGRRVGTCQLRMQSDGNVVVYDGGAVWATNTQHTGPAGRITLQTDGNLVEYNGFNQPVWAQTYGREAIGTGTQLTPNHILLSGAMNFTFNRTGDLDLYRYGRLVWHSNTAGKGGTRLVMQTDGNLVLYTSTGHAVWASHTQTAGANCYLAVSSSGVVEIVNHSGAVVWKS